LEKKIEKKNVYVVFYAIKFRKRMFVIKISGVKFMGFGEVQKLCKTDHMELLGTTICKRLFLSKQEYKMGNFKP
jgi:hypothetical protein